MPEPQQRQWAAELIPIVAIEAIMTWLDTGQPHHDNVGPTVQAMIDGVLTAIRADRKPDSDRETIKR